MQVIKTPDLQRVTDISATTTNNITLNHATTPTISTGSGKDLNLIPGAGGVTVFGDAGKAGQYSSPTNDDVSITGRLEVKGIAYFLNTSAFFYSVQLKDTQPNLAIYNGTQYYGYFRGAADDGLRFAVGVDADYGNHNFIFTNITNIGVDHDHDFLNTNPTIYIHSALSADTNNNRWGSICHSGTAGSAGKFELCSGNGSIIQLQSGARDGTNFVNVAVDMQRACVTGTHSGGNNATALADSTANWSENIFVGHTLYNVTDGSSGTITANNATSITATLSGGSENDWDTNDVYAIGIRGTHSGSNNVATLTDGTKSWTPNAYAGWRVYNVTDGSSGVISANSSTTVTANLEGGTDNDWDTNDVYVLSNAPNGTDTGSLFEVRNGAARAMRISPLGTLRLENAHYVNYRQVSAFKLSAGGSGATEVIPTSSTLGGWQLNAATEYIYVSHDIHGDWDAASDIEVHVTYEINAAGSDPADTVNFQLLCYYKGAGEAVTKTQTPTSSTTIGTAAQYTQFEAEFLIDYDLGGNVVQVGDTFAMRLNLNTGDSEVDDVTINHIEILYKTKQPCMEYSQA